MKQTIHFTGEGRPPKLTFFVSELTQQRSYISSMYHNIKTPTYEKHRISSELNPHQNHSVRIGCNT